MSQVSFGSTYRIPVNQWGINNTKKIQLKSLVDSYAGIIVGKGKDQVALLSISDKKDFGFLKKLRKLGYFELKQIEGEKIPKDNLLAYVNYMLSQIKK